MMDVDIQGQGALGAPRMSLGGNSQPGRPGEPEDLLCLADAEK